MDGRCDWKGCESVYVMPAVVRLHEHDDAEHDDEHTDEWKLELCTPHTQALVQFIEFTPWHEDALGQVLDEAR